MLDIMVSETLLPLLGTAIVVNLQGIFLLSNELRLL